MKAKPELSTILYTCISILFLLIFIPVLFCVLFLGNTMDYYENVKLITLFGNKRIAIFSILVIQGFFLLFALLKRRKLTKKLSMFTNLGLGAAFVLLYFANVEVCKCIWFKQGWDVECVVGSAYGLLAGNPIGSEVYYSIYPNNVPMTFILYVIYGLAHRLPFYPYTPDFLWLQVICGLVSVTGFVTCITVKKLTGSLAATITGCLLYVACIGISPWKTVPYTDMFALLFPILCLCLYVYYFYEEVKVKKCIFLFAAYFVGIMGSLVKPTVLVVVIAITVLELVQGIKSLKMEWKELLN